ncbi:hypothetical protein [Halomonas denitrificans]|uniref:hypothetical protein n=1 Tax=Halomonas denitrificans TaxID=370769 RepID=UPI000D375009|nr:hypothetical protein [Halomonas denitrificans]
MTARHRIAVAALAAVGLAASQIAMACQGGELFALGGTARAGLSDDGITLDRITELQVPDAHHMTRGVGHRFGDLGSAGLPYRHFSEQALEELETEDSPGIAALDPHPLGGSTSFHF